VLDGPCLSNLRHPLQNITTGVLTDVCIFAKIPFGASVADADMDHLVLDNNHFISLS